MRTGLCNCIAFYDWRGDFGASRFHDVALTVFHANGVEPDTGSLFRSENDVRPYKTVLADLALARDGVDFYHTLANYGQLIFGWDLCSLLQQGEERTMVFCYPQDMAGIGLNFLAGMARTLAQELQLTYGIGYQRDFDLGPDLYAYGLDTGLEYSPEDMAEGDRIAAWLHERMNKRNRHLAGLLRDVYPLNVLSRPHVERRIGEQAFGAWIEAAPDRGRLEPLANDAWLWTVPEERLLPVREEIKRSAPDMLLY